MSVKYTVQYLGDSLDMYQSQKHDVGHAHQFVQHINLCHSTGEVADDATGACLALGECVVPALQNGMYSTHPARTNVPCTMQLNL